MKLDFIIPASPTDAFFSQLAMFRVGLDALGGPYRDARLVAVFGDEAYSPLPAAWRPHFERIEVEWATPEAFKRVGYRAQGDRRFEVIRPDADLVILCDADTLMLRPFSQDVFDVARDNAIGGVIAHYHFPWEASSGDTTIDWNTISRRTIGTEIDLPFHYTLLDQSLPGACPFYINLGFLVGSPESLLKLQQSCENIRSNVIDIVRNYFDAQVTIPLAAAQKGIKTTPLPIRYNFPNDPIADAAYPDDLIEICLIHYLRTDKFDRHAIFKNDKEFANFLGLSLNGSNLIFQKRIKHLTNGDYPFRADSEPPRR